MKEHAEKLMESFKERLERMTMYHQLGDEEKAEEIMLSFTEDELNVAELTGKQLILMVKEIREVKEI